VLVYDEPASGLDPVTTTNSVLEFTRELRSTGKTVVFSAHNLYHVESVCDRVAVMDGPDRRPQQRVDRIRERHGETTYRVFTDVSPARTDALADIFDDIDAAIEEVGDRFRTTVPTMDAVAAVRETAAAAGGEVVDIRESRAWRTCSSTSSGGRCRGGTHRGRWGRSVDCGDRDGSVDGIGGGRVTDRSDRVRHRIRGAQRRLRRILRVARWETVRASGGVDRRTLLAALALLLVAGGVLGGGLAAGVVGLDVDRDVYRVAVDGDSPYADAVEAEPSLTAVPLGSAALNDTADLVVFDGRQSGSIETVAVRASDARKGEAAAAEFREAVKAHNERLMAAEENRTAAFPITVTLQYTSAGPAGSTTARRSAGDGSESDGGSGRASGDDSGDASGGTDGGLTGGDTASEGSGGDDGDNGGFAVPSVWRRGVRRRHGRVAGVDLAALPVRLAPPRVRLSRADELPHPGVRLVGPRRADEPARGALLVTPSRRSTSSREDAPVRRGRGARHDAHRSRRRRQGALGDRRASGGVDLPRGPRSSARCSRGRSRSSPSSRSA